jgi:transcriptional regulator with XRE-family HTH domain
MHLIRLRFSCFSRFQMPSDAPVLVPPTNPNASERAAITERLRLAVMKNGGPTQISERAGMSLSTLNAYLGGGEMKLSNLLRIARVCGVSVEWIATGTGVLPRWLRKDAAVMGLSSERQAPLAASGIDPHWLAKAIEIVESLGGAKLSPRERAERIAHSYHLLTAPETDLPPLPQLPQRRR